MIPIFIPFSALYLIIVSCMFSTMYLVNKDYHYLGYLLIYIDLNDVIDVKMARDSNVYTCT